MNLIPKIAKELGVEIGERFEVDSIDHSQGIYYYFTETELLEHRTNRYPDYAQYRILADLIYGDKKVIKIPFEPKIGEKYFYISTTHPMSVESAEWSGSDYVIERAFKYCGNVFRTKAEAEAHKYEIYERLTGKKWEEK